MDNITEKVHLVRGVEHNGARHTTLTMRPSTVGDAMAAEKKYEGKGLMLLSTGIICEQIVEFGSIPKDAITPDLLAQLVDEDFERINEVREYLKKKVRWQQPA
jgi:phage FluMu protein gp41